MSMPVDPFGGPSAEQIDVSASGLKFGVTFTGTSGADLLLGRVVEEPRMWASPVFGGAAFNVQARILANDVDKLGVDIRSFRVPLRRSVEQVMIPSIATNFAVGGRPRWQPLSIGTVENRGSAEPVLIRTGKLRRVATQKNMWSYFTGTIGREVNYVEFDQSQLEKSAPYGVFHQYGAASHTDPLSKMIKKRDPHALLGEETANWRLPQRMFVTMRPEDQVEIYSIFYQWLSERVDYHYYGYGNKPGRR
jgi:phage gpG-like protein